MSRSLCPVKRLLTTTSCLGVLITLLQSLGEEAIAHGQFDAPIGYHSITAAYTDKWQEWWINPDNVQLYQFMGKDSRLMSTLSRGNLSHVQDVFFHTVLFPAMLLADGRNWTMPHNISSTRRFIRISHRAQMSMIKADCETTSTTKAGSSASRRMWGYSGTMLSSPASRLRSGVTISCRSGLKMVIRHLTGPA